MAVGWFGEDGPFATTHLVTADEWNSQRLPYYIDGTVIDVVSTGSATSIYSLSIPGGTVNDSGVVRLTIWGDYLNNDGAGRTLTLAITLGGSTYYTDTSASITNNATRRPWYLTFWMVNIVSSQFFAGRFVLGTVGATSGFGDMATVDPVMDAPFQGQPVKDMTSAQTLALTIQHSASSANLSFRKVGSLLEVFPG